MELLSDYLKKNKIKPKKFEPHAEIDAKNKLIHIYLEDCSHFWEYGTGLHIYVSNDNSERVVGASLPLRKYNGKFKVYKINEY